MVKRKLTPPQLAREWGVDHGKILSLIAAGELRAINISEGRQRPRYLIDVDDIAAFELRRETRPLPQCQTGRPSGSSPAKQYV